MLEVNPEIFELSNGAKIVYLKTDTLVAHMGVFFKAGSRYESSEEMGLAHFLEHCIFKGTHKRKAFDIFTDLDSVGGELNAYTTKEEICVHASFRKNHFPIAAELLGDIVQNASFPPEEIEKEKEVVLDEIISYLDSPIEKIYDDFESRIFRGNSLGYNTLGTKKSVNSFSRESLLRYKEKYFIPSNMIISFVGNVDLKELKREIELNFGEMEGKTIPSLELFVPKFETFNDTLKESNFQAHTVLGGRAPSYYDNSRRGMTLLMNVLGGPALNARLTLSIREKHGYAYNIESNYTTYEDTGFWSVYMGTDKKYLKKAIDLIYKEFDLIDNEGLSALELIQAKEQLKGHIALSLDNNNELMFTHARSIMVRGKVDSMAQIYNQIDQIQLNELTEIAKTSFDRQSIGQLTYKY
ncbi:MAG: insulinase family protein [Flavobacteriales bacterium]|nr:insulinase family protein [Flavobacteriales bacterium]